MDEQGEKQDVTTTAGGEVPASRRRRWRSVIGRCIVGLILALWLCEMALGVLAVFVLWDLHHDRTTQGKAGPALHSEGMAQLKAELEELQARKPRR